MHLLEEEWWMGFVSSIVIAYVLMLGVFSWYVKSRARE